MNALATRRPISTLEKACPEYAEALREFEKLWAAGKDTEAAKAWDRAALIAQAFNRGKRFATVEGGKP